MGLFFCFCWFSRRFLENQKNLRENQQYKRQPKQTKQKLRGNQKNKVFKSFRPTLGYGFVFWGLLVFPKVFRKPIKPQGKPKIPKKTKPISKGGSETFKNFVCLVFPKVFLVFFGFLLYVWFSLRFFWFSKNLRENQQTNKTNPYPRVGLKP